MFAYQCLGFFLGLILNISPYTHNLSKIPTAWKIRDFLYLPTFKCFCLLKSFNIKQEHFCKVILIEFKTIGYVKVMKFRRIQGLTRNHTARSVLLIRDCLDIQINYLLMFKKWIPEFEKKNVVRVLSWIPPLKTALVFIWKL